MPRYWMITNRNVKKSGLGIDHTRLSLWVSDERDIDRIDNWEQLGKKQFRDSLLESMNEFPKIHDLCAQEQQRHVTLFIHGFNNSWEDAAMRYRSICDSLYTGNKSLGLCILFTWPSDGMFTNYLPDRMDARKTAPDLADVLCEFYDWLIDMQRLGARDPEKGCWAKTSIIAHSMGNYVLQKAMQIAWTRKNQPLLVSLINQLVMVAADVDNNLFAGSHVDDGADGIAMKNLIYRITALYSGRDPVLGMSAGLKHFGTRRLGRSGLNKKLFVPDNVWDVDCSKLFSENQDDIHSAYFEEPRTIELMRSIFSGCDRGVMKVAGLTTAG